MALLPSPLPLHRVSQDRDKIITWARKLLSKRDFVILDTETTGTDGSDEVIQIGIIDSEGNELLDSLVKPETKRSIPKKAQSVHGITTKMLANAPTLYELSELIMETIGSRLVICFNDEFDMRMIDQTAQKYDLPSRGKELKFKSECAMLAYSQFVGSPGLNPGEYRWQKLPRHGEEQHKALADCQLTLELIKEIADTNKQSELLDFAPEMVLPVQQSLPVGTLQIR